MVPFVPIDFSRPFYPGPVLIAGLGSVDQCPEKYYRPKSSG